MATGKLARWHYRLGMLSALFVLIMAVTGIMINHTSQLQLDKHYVQNNLVLDWYKIAPKGETRNFQAQGFFATKLDNRLFLSNGKFVAKEIAQTPAPLNGVAVSGRMVLVATSDHIYLLTHKGQMVEKLSASSNQWGAIKTIGTSTAPGKNVWLHTSNGYFQADRDIAAWNKKASVSGVDWSRSVNLPDKIKQKVLVAFRGKGLTMERILLDLHTGRIVGDWGVYVMDAAAIIFIILALSGMTVWLRRRSRLRRATQVV